MQFQTVTRGGYGAEKVMLPYRSRRGATVWPNGATMAVVLYIAAEQWAWDGYERPASPPTGPGRGAGAGDKPPLSTRTAVNYGFEVGMWRLFDLLSEAGLPSTIWMSGLAAEEFSEVVAAGAALGIEIGGHSYSQGLYISGMSEQEQRSTIQTSRKILEQVAGRPVRGWLGPSAVADATTLRLLAEEGFLYNGDLQDDELPYTLRYPDGKSIVEIPYRMMGNVNDYRIWGNTAASTATGFEFLTGAFDGYLATSRTTPLLFNFGMHPFVSGRPDISTAVGRFLGHITAAENVWVATYTEVAEWWKSLTESSDD